MHWHAFLYNGQGMPSDSAAKDPGQAVRPLALNDWFRKPRSMHKGAYADADSAYAWIEAELRECVPEMDADRLPGMLRLCREHLDLKQDAYVGAYTQNRSGIYVRALLTCPRTGADIRPVTCPGPPA